MSNNQTLRIYPEQLIPNEANEKARPAETAEQRTERVQRMAKSICSTGQTHPVIAIHSDSDGIYEYIDGGGRVDAIKLINEGYCSGGKAPDEPMKVEILLRDDAADFYRIAVVSNIERTQNSLNDMIGIIRESRERNGWKGRGADSKVAEYLGILPSRVSEYGKVAAAPPEIKSRIASGEIKSLDAALKLMAVPDDKRAEVTERASELAKQDAAAQSSNSEQTDGAASMTSRHVQAAASESGVSVGKRNAKAISEWFGQITEACYGPEVVAFVDYLTGEYIPGTGTDRKLLNLFDEMVGTDSATKKAKAKEYKEQQKAEEVAEKERLKAEAEAAKAPKAAKGKK